MRLRLLIAATALFATQPAAAGIIAHYRMGQGPEQRLVVVEVNDRGDSRADMGGGQVLLLLDGTFYVVETDAEGTYAARAEDAFAILEVDMGNRRSAHGPDPAMPTLPPPPQVQLIRGGTEIVAGHRGTVWRVRDPAAPAGASAEEFVVSADPELAPLNNILGPRRQTAPDPAFDANGAAAARWAIYQRGAILREGRHLRLERVEIRPMPEPFALPGPALSREALAARARRTGR
ncbi:MAG TPA: hypothetical protein VEX35_15685 [Allosphingosinicella sp.]|nr:hypothetical protein [Allosphingosinicella sp.]